MALSFGNRHRNLTTNIWPTQRQQLLVRKQHSFIETGNSFNTSNRGRGILTKGLSVGRSYDGIRQKFNTPNANTLRSSGSYACLQRQSTVEHDFKLKTNPKQKDTYLRNSKNPTQFNGSSTRLNCNTRRNTCGSTNNCENFKIKEKSIVAWSSTTSLFKSDEDDDVVNSNRKNCRPIAGDSKLKETRKASITANPLQQRLHSSTKAEVNKINLNIVLPQAAKISLDNDTVLSDIESSLDSGVNTDSIYPLSSKATAKHTAQETVKRVLTSPSSVLQADTTATATTSTCTSTASAQLQFDLPNYTNSAVYRRAQFRSSHLNSTTTTTATTTATPTAIAIATTTATGTSNAISSVSSTPSSQTTICTVITTPATTPFSASPSLTVQRRPPLVRAMSAPVRPLDDNSKATLAASKRKPRRRRIVARNISCDKTTEQDFITNEIINGKKVLTRSRSVVASEVITLVSLMSSEGSDSEREDLQTSPSTSSAKSESSPARRAPSLRKTGKSVSFQENYPPNFQLASKEYSHMIRRGSIAPLTARMRTNRPPTAPPGSIFLNMTSNTEPILIKDRNMNSECNEKRTPMDEKSENNESTTNDTTTTTMIAKETTEYVFPDYVRSIKERECWKLYQKMCNKGVNVSYDTILRGMLTPTEFRQIQKQRELEEAKEREAEAAIEGENAKPPSQSAIDRLSEALSKK